MSHTHSTFTELAEREKPSPHLFTPRIDRTRRKTTPLPRRVVQIFPFTYFKDEPTIYGLTIHGAVLKFSRKPGGGGGEMGAESGGSHASVLR